jgi:hypothetical protein
MDIKEPVEAFLRELSDYGKRHGTARFERHVEELRRALKAEPLPTSGGAAAGPGARVLPFRSPIARAGGELPQTAATQP